MAFREKLSVVVHSCASIGAVETFKALVRHAMRTKIDDKAFDRRYGTDTAARIKHDALGMPDAAAQKHATIYRTASERYIAYVIGHLGIDYRQYDFIDIGCGKGRVLLVASGFPFRSIRGIELSQPALAIAERNIRTYRNARQQCFDIAVSNADARSFAPPAANTVYYFFEPFDSTVLAAVLTQIASSLRGQGHSIIAVCIWSDLKAVLPLFAMHGFRQLRTQRALMPSLNYGVFVLA